MEREKEGHVKKGRDGWRGGEERERVGEGRGGRGGWRRDAAGLMNVTGARCQSSNLISIGPPHIGMYGQQRPAYTT